jgi:hypothetical protein
MPQRRTVRNQMRIAGSGWLLAAAAGLLAAGCVSRSEPDAAPPPVLALPPAALGCEVAVQQRLTVKPPGRPAQQVETLLEVDAQTVRLAFFAIGQNIGSFAWNGYQWEKQLSPHWPVQLAPEQVLSDVQLAFWPLPAVQQGLPSAWQVEESEAGRRLLRDGQEQVLVRFIDRSSIEIIYPAGPFALRVESPGGAHLCNSAQDPS